MELQYYKAVSLYRRRFYDKSIELCNSILKTGQESKATLFNNENVSSSRNGRNNYKDEDTTKQVIPSWMMEGIWQLKMLAMTQRIFVDDLETNDDFNEEHDELEFERLATAARPGTSIKTAFIPRPDSSFMGGGRRTATQLGYRPASGIVRPGTTIARPGSSITNRPSSRCATARRICMTSAAVFNLGDATSSLYQASRMNPTIYAERENITKALFQFLFYHEGDANKALTLCESVADVHKQNVDWWWNQQRGRCLIALNHPKKAEVFLLQSLSGFLHPDTYLLLSKLHQKLGQLEQALQVVKSAVDNSPYDVALRTEMGRVYELMGQRANSVLVYRKITSINPINVEALACIAVHYFYDDNPKLALMFYRRILSMGAHNAEIYCNIALCCLYAGQIDLVIPCFRRALLLATTPQQTSDIWYNISFVGIINNDLNLARRCLRLCLTSDPTNGAALNNLAVLSALGGELKKAKSYLSAAKEMISDSKEVDANLKFMQQEHML